MRPGGDFELGKYAVEVRSDRSVRQAEALADLAVGETVCGHLSDRKFLGRQLFLGFGGALPASFPSGGQFLTSSLARIPAADGVEQVSGRSQRFAGLGNTTLTAEPTAVSQVQAGQLEGPVVKLSGSLRASSKRASAWSSSARTARA